MQCGGIDASPESAAFAMNEGFSLIVYPVRTHPVFHVGRACATCFCDAPVGLPPVAAAGWHV